jgi:hypothetical protein
VGIATSPYVVFKKFSTDLEAVYHLERAKPTP